MATKIIKVWIDGAIQEIEVEDIVSPEQPLSVEDRLIELEDKPIVTDGNILVGNGTEELEEMTPEEMLMHINGASVSTITTDEYNELEQSNSINANTLYMLSDANEEHIRYVAQDVAPDDTNVFWVDTSDSTVDYEQIVVDTTLTQSGYAADAKKTGDAIKLKADLSYVIDLENNKIPSIDKWLQTEGRAADAKATGDAISKLTAKLNSMIYVGDTEPTNVVDGMVWVDTGESQSINNENNEVS